jgi:hypothetical protein
MPHLASIRRLFKTSTAAAVCWLACCATALAAEAEGGSSKGGGGTWIMSYALVMLIVGLGLLVVLKSTNRRERAPTEQFDD